MKIKPKFNIVTSRGLVLSPDRVYNAVLVPNSDKVLVQTYDGGWVVVRASGVQEVIKVEVVVIETYTYIPLPNGLTLVVVETEVKIL